MRVHGTSAQIQYHSQPDTPAKYVRAVPRKSGMRVESNFPAQLSIHMSVPTPLIVDRTEPLLSFGTRSKPQIFESRSVHVERLQVFLKLTRASVGTFTAMDGNRKLVETEMSKLYKLIPSDDQYIEDSLPAVTVYTCDIDRKLLGALGFSFEVGMQSFGEQSEILVVGAKAVFRSTE
ncbi:hypothetical protein VST63_25830 [Mycolicibacterium sp. 050232]|uniref:hypothetical protein n=1 Tax=Mycolicibacterium sp. 050232 TaxID=3113982 RepID=UPI002E2B38C4|nr:hypothetical protein [Mycolicibacterium sp. 050232]MED5815793.1 hypothetical protein [Mycolicibacterium sp. 050232]